jgi:tripartite-type tricarboxylate transporter receptor subunit TctC
MITEKMQTHHKGNIIVDNRPGAGGTVGATLAARATPQNAQVQAGFDFGRNAKPSSPQK